MSYATLSEGCLIGSQILPNTFPNQTVCSVGGPNATLPSNCCASNVETYLCQKYCAVSPGTSLRDFVTCTNATEPFCQSPANSTVIRSVKTSSGLKLVPGLLFMLVVFTTAANARIIHSLGLERRDASTCNINIDRSYTSTRASQKVSANFDCTNAACYLTVPIDTGITTNNRTLNATSAADSRYDGFFDLLGNKTFRYFPAMSSLQVQFGFYNRHTAYIGWTAYAWCVNGTVSGCTDVLPDGLFDACGPFYVSEVDHPSNNTIRNGTIQGVLIPVQLV